MNCSDTTKQYFYREITVFGVDVTVEFRFSKGYDATLYEPESADEVVVKAVFVEGLDIIGLCGEEALKEIERKIFMMFDNGEAND